MKKHMFILVFTFCCTCFFAGDLLANKKNVFEPVTVRASISAPSLTVTTVDTTVSLSWTSVSGATGYTLYYAPYPDVTSIGSIDMGNKTSLSASLSEGNAFYVAIQAYNNNGSSGYSNICYFILSWGPATQSVIETVQGKLPANVILNDIDHAIFAHPTPQPAGVVIQERIGTTQVIVPADSWVYWVESDPLGKYSHTSFLYLVDRVTGAVTEYPFEHTPLINADKNGWGGGLFAPTDDQLIQQRIGLGEIVETGPISGQTIDLPPLSPEEDGSCGSPQERLGGQTASNESGPNPCFFGCTPTRYGITILGHPERKEDITNFLADEPVAEKLFASSGVGVSEANLRSFDARLQSLKWSEILAYIRSLKMKCCDELFIYYSGHNDKAGEMELSGNESTEGDITISELRTLLVELAESGEGSRVSFILDACYAGGIARNFETTWKAAVEANPQRDRIGWNIIYSAKRKETAHTGSVQGGFSGNDGSWFTQIDLARAAASLDKAKGPTSWEHLINFLNSEAGFTLSRSSSLLHQILGNQNISQTSGYVNRKAGIPPCGTCGDGIVQPWCSETCESDTDCKADQICLGCECFDLPNEPQVLFDDSALFGVVGGDKGLTLEYDSITNTVIAVPDRTGKDGIPLMIFSDPPVGIEPGWVDAISTSGSCTRTLPLANNPEGGPSFFFPSGKLLALEYDCGTFKLAAEGSVNIIDSDHVWSGRVLKVDKR